MLRDYTLDEWLVTDSLDGEGDTFFSRKKIEQDQQTDDFWGDLGWGEFPNIHGGLISQWKGQSMFGEVHVA